MSSNRRRFTGRTALALPALGAALALVVTSCSASTDSAVSGTVVSSSGSASASASATSTQALFPTPSASPSASASATPSASSPAPAPSVVTITVHAEPTASESKTSESESKSEAKSESKKDSTCASDSASTVVSKALRELKNKSKWDQWTNVSRTYEGYDPCAELSWIDAIPGSSPSDCCISSMAHHILLFHRGKFIGTATYEPYSFSPVITRTSDSSISVTYRYVKGDESSASASGRTTAEFSWSSSQNKVVMTGEVPPSE
ncbi:LppP/LprE family lipoprotein [Rothia sp. (in: high G+C Gram-positive bacteria)]|uniref:LppP/LprE family lipoprotein n=1 Tax=Rothia sp. (in: high G+C Gram-positive bacteria) TaxID=1885016 RepID=UPI001CADA50B|nr:LppP/LprE family lipoprotein [Rothia sp. (in: high G+C Gram-positive bacteria)]MBF1668093.1 LppP/LprE family lipoprotein [Rothia sp. (in: high G+C Gram-positive bacteria)]